MPLDLPGPIASYIAAENLGDADAVARCFTAQAIVRDEAQTVTGSAAIRQWKAETTKKYRHSMEALRVAHEGSKTIVTNRLTDDFPGSPIELRFAFALEGDRIAWLEIRP